MSELEVDAQDVVRLMLQFCKENGLKVCFPCHTRLASRMPSLVIPVITPAIACACMRVKAGDARAHMGAIDLGEQDSLKTLQTESQVALNTVESVEGFLTDVQSGNWY
jgi:hypothetical protein